MKLARRREDDHPDESIRVFLRELETTFRVVPKRSYEAAVALLGTGSGRPCSGLCAGRTFGPHSARSGLPTSGGGGLRLALDTMHNRLYVGGSDAADPHVAVFDAINTRDGNVAPNHNIVDQRRLRLQLGLGVEFSRNILYAALKTPAR